MRMFSRVGFMATSAWAVVVGILLSSQHHAVEARPEYKKGFETKYKEYFDKAKTTINCDVCHVKGMKKTENNQFGKDYGKELGEKKVKDMKKIDEALGKTEDKDSPVEGKKYIDLIKDGKFPAGNDP